MKKILTVTSLALMLVVGSVSGAMATLWMPTDGDVNYFSLHAFDDGEVLAMFGPDETFSDVNPGDYLTLLTSENNAATVNVSIDTDGTWKAELNGNELVLGDSAYFQLGFRDTNGSWSTAIKIDEVNNTMYELYFGDDVIALQIDAKPVPIPGAAWLLGSGLFGLLAIRRRVKS